MTKIPHRKRITKCGWMKPEKKKELKKRRKNPSKLR